MTIRINDLHFEGPYSSPMFLEDMAGIYAIFCQKHNGEYRLLDVRDATKVKSHAEHLNYSGLCWSRHCNCSIVFAVRYKSTVDNAGQLDTRHQIRGLSPPFSSIPKN